MNHQEQFRLKVGLAEMLKGGVIMDVMTPDQARIAEEAGAAAVMALERIPSRIRREGGVARMSDPRMIQEIESSVSIPVMAKCRIGHFAEAQILEHLGVDFIDESEVLTPADEEHHIWKHDFKVPFVCGCRDLGEALRRIGEGAAMIRTKGEAGTGDIVEAVRHMRSVQKSIKRLSMLRDDELMAEAKTLGAPFELVQQVARTGKLPVPNFAAGGVATPADASLMMQLGAESVFVGSGIFEISMDLKPEEQRRDQLLMAQAIVKAVANYNRPEILTEASTNLPKAMKGQAVESIADDQQLAEAGLVTVTEPRVGVLALQGDFACHQRSLAALGAEAVRVSVPADLERLEALILPGGESTTMLRLLESTGLRPGIERFVHERPVLGTCAGLILLARDSAGLPRPTLGVLDVTVERNGYGRQVDSFAEALEAPLPGGPIHGVFIRAPRIRRVGDGVEVIVRRGAEPVGVRQGRAVGIAFHPELTQDLRLHRWFLEQVAGLTLAGTAGARTEGSAA